VALNIQNTVREGSVRKTPRATVALFTRFTVPLQVSRTQTIVSIIGTQAASVDTEGRGLAGARHLCPCPVSHISKYPMTHRWPFNPP
jgi:hypothetical protein